jgi:hypothetical protein
MFALTLTLSLLAMPGARLVTDEPLLSPAEVATLDRELRILDGNIQLLKPNIPTGFVIGMALGFSFAVLLLPGIPLLISGTLSSSALLAFGSVLTGIGGLGLLAALICLVLGNSAESNQADERARMVERRDAIRRQLEPHRRRPTTPEPAPGYVPGVQLDLPSPALITLVHF